MRLKKFVWIPVFIGLISATIQMVDSLLSPFMLPHLNSGFSWIAFQACALYFLAGGTIKGGIKTLIGYINGIILAMLIFIIGEKLSSFNFFAFPIAIVIVVSPAMFLERNQWTDFIPALFIGASAYFCFISYIPDATYGGAAATEFLYCVIGLFYGYLITTVREIYEKRVSISEANHIIKHRLNVTHFQ